MFKTWSLFAVLLLSLAIAPEAYCQESDEEATSAEVAAESEMGDEGEGGHDEDHAAGSHDEDGDHGEAHGGAHDGEHGEEHHVDNDPTHANMTDATYEVIDFRTDMALFSGVVFLLLLAGLSLTAWKPIMEGLQKREETIASNIADAEQASEDAKAKLAEYEAKLATANDEAAQIVSEARKDAEAAGQKLVAAAQEDAAKIKERATSDIESAKRVALGELADQSTAVAMSVAQRVVGREVKADDHQGLIQEMLSKLPSKN
ncbi:MAG: F0F1 ATP synthase subunit B [Planctomycetota bacterium]